MKKKTNNEKFSDIEVGPVTTKKLREAGVNSAIDILIMGSEEIAIATGMKREDADDLESKALASLAEQGKLPSFGSTVDVLKFQRAVSHLPAGCKSLDTMLRGGVETKSLTEVYGVEGAGKTQWIMSLAVEALKAGNNIVVIDCENTFDFERLEEIARARGFEINDDVMNRIHLEITPDTYLIRRAITHLPKIIQEKNVKLILVDGLVGKYRLEYDQGRGVLNDRQNHIKHPIRRLSNIALYLDVAVVFTNQVTANPDGQYSGEADKGIGGHIFGHNVKYILKFNKGAKNKRIAHFKKSNKDPLYDVEFFLTEKGVTDPSEVDASGQLKQSDALPPLKVF